MNTTPSPQAAHMVGELRRNAVELCAADRPSAAEMLLQAALEIQANDCDVLADLAALQLRHGQLDKAMGTARTVLAQSPQHPVGTYTLAMALSASGEEARACFLLTELTQGLRGEAFARSSPELHRSSLAELQRLALPAAAPAAVPHIVSTRFSGEGAAKYTLDHLVQKAHQKVGGPIQDDEALMLYALVRVMRLRRVLEIGGLDGYSARNFLAALGDETDAAVYTVDISPVKSQAAHHHVMTKDCAQVTPEDVHGRPLDLIFFDAHVRREQLALLDRLDRAGLVERDAVIALHDTNLHPRKTASWSYPLREDGEIVGYVHQAAERKMVNELHQRGWDALCLHLPTSRGDARLPVRHGLTLMQRFRPLAT